MEEDYIPDEPKGYWTEIRPLYKITYRCMHCGHENHKFQPLLREGERTNKDYRQYCPTCKIILNHTRHDPKLTP